MKAKFIMFIMIALLTVSVAYSQLWFGYDFGRGSNLFAPSELSTSGITRQTISVGQDKYPVVCDINGNLEDDILTFSGNGLRHYSESESTFIERASVNVGSTIRAIACVGSPLPSFESDVLIVWTDTGTKQYHKNLAVTDGDDEWVTNALDDIDFNTTRTFTTQPFCAETYSSRFDLNFHYCTIGVTDGIEIITNDIYSDPWENLGGNLFINVTGAGLNSPVGSNSNVYYDWQNDLIYYRGADYASGTSLTSRLYTLFIDDCLYTTNSTCLIDSGATTERNPSVYGIQSGADTPQNSGRSFLVASPSNVYGTGLIVCQNSIFSLTMPDSVVRNSMYCLQNDVVVVNTYGSFVPGGSYSIKSSIDGSPVFFDINQNTEYEVCSSIWGTRASGTPTDGQGLINCFSPTTGAVVKSYTGYATNREFKFKTIGYFEESGRPCYGYYYDGDIVYYCDDSSTGLDTFTLETMPDRNYYLIDVNKDNRNELIGESSSGIAIAHSIEAGADDILVNTNIDYEGLYGFYDPACVDTEVTVKAKECVSSFSGCTYYNYNRNPYVRERLVGDCNGVEVVGNWSYTSPVWECTYTNTSSKTIDLHLETDTAPNLVAYDFDSFSITVSDDLEVCNENLEEEGDPGFGGTPEEPEEPEEEEEETLPDDPDIFQLLDHYKLMLFGLFIIFGAIYMVSAYGRITNVYVLGMVGFLALIFTNVIGLIPIGWTILIMMMSVILIVLKITIFNSGSGSE